MMLVKSSSRFQIITASTLALYSLTLSTPSLAMSTASGAPKVIDSHLHVWASADEAASSFPYAPGNEPPESLKSRASTSALLEQMDAYGVDGALIVQPINHKFDHSYVLEAMRLHPGRFKGMLLHDPSVSAEEAVSELEDLVLKGFVGVRFNPYLWPDSKQMSNDGSGAGLAVYKRCAELHVPVGIMCFKGLSLHYDDILKLIGASPETMLVLDHFGFTRLDEEGSDETFKMLLSLAKFPNVVVKISALFRLNDPSPYVRVHKERLLPLLEAYGADRLMFGTDFPFALEQPEEYGGMVKQVSAWLPNEKDRAAVMGETAQRLFGPWGSPVLSRDEL